MSSPQLMECAAYWFHITQYLWLILHKSCLWYFILLCGLFSQHYIIFVDSLHVCACNPNIWLYIRVSEALRLLSFLTSSHTHSPVPAISRCHVPIQRLLNFLFRFQELFCRWSVVHQSSQAIKKNRFKAVVKGLNIQICEEGHLHVVYMNIIGIS